MTRSNRCECFARCEADCVCDADWTPEEVICLRAELAECKRDAERYRWLRASSMNQREIYGDFVMNLDDAIDAALRGERMK